MVKIKYRIRYKKFQVKMTWLFTMNYFLNILEKIDKNYKTPKWFKQKIEQYDAYVLRQLKALAYEGEDILCDTHNDRCGLL